MNNHHDIVYVPAKDGEEYTHVVCNRPFKDEFSEADKEPTIEGANRISDVFVFTKEELDKRDKELLEGKQKIKSERNVKQPCEGCSTDCYNWQIGDCRS